MKIHEYQAKEILARYGVRTPENRLATTVEEALDHTKVLGSPWVVKAQIHAGGRGKGGGVKICQTAEEVKEAASAILGMKLVTHQTGPEGQEVTKIIVEEGCDIDRELYLGMVIDRASEKPVVMASSKGGMDIEKVATEDADAMLFEDVDSDAGLPPFAGRRLAARLGLPNECIGSFAKVAVAFSKMFLAEDCSLAEINPLVITKQGDLIALDGKINFDDNALYRERI